ncbi:hypothetical protein V8F33_013764 [Rhypophila sp. PSN 637]
MHRSFFVGGLGAAILAALVSACRVGHSTVSHHPVATKTKASSSTGVVSMTAPAPGVATATVTTTANTAALTVTETVTATVTMTVTVAAPAAATAASQNSDPSQDGDIPEHGHDHKPDHPCPAWDGTVRVENRARANPYRRWDAEPRDRGDERHASTGEEHHRENGRHVDGGDYSDSEPVYPLPLPRATLRHLQPVRKDNCQASQDEASTTDIDQAAPAMQTKLPCPMQAVRHKREKQNSPGENDVNKRDDPAPNPDPNMKYKDPLTGFDFLGMQDVSGFKFGMMLPLPALSTRSSAVNPDKRNIVNENDAIIQIISPLKEGGGWGGIVFGQSMIKKGTFTNESHVVATFVCGGMPATGTKGSIDVAEDKGEIGSFSFALSYMAILDHSDVGKGEDGSKAVVTDHTTRSEAMGFFKVNLTAARSSDFGRLVALVDKTGGSDSGKGGNATTNLQHAGGSGLGGAECVCECKCPPCSGSEADTSGASVDGYINYKPANMWYGFTKGWFAILSIMAFGYFWGVWMSF